MAGQSGMAMKGVKKGRSQEFYTPVEILYHLYSANGYNKLDLDPCSPCHGEEAPTYPWCKQHYTAKDNSLTKEWNGRIYCNPPYSNIGAFLEKGWAEVAKGNAETIIFLIPLRTDQKWHQLYIHWKYSPKILFNRRSIKFSEPSVEFIERHNLDVSEVALERIKARDGKGMGTIPEAMQLVFFGNFRPFTDYFMALPRREFPIFKSPPRSSSWRNPKNDGTRDDEYCYTIYDETGNEHDYSNNRQAVVSLSPALDALDRAIFYLKPNRERKETKGKPLPHDECKRLLAADAALFKSDRARKNNLTKYINVLRNSIIQEAEAKPKPKPKPKPNKKITLTNDGYVKWWKD
ncbi:DNA N-6-adenine-methyltransferase [Paramagnetospirillum caucaseum]|uniref:DNA N-6-adenine-methyltransferase n=1 Tax=Paramagnetospirillum caucaseum TaxID=1244869 RepID=UPI0009DA2B3F|nr:DNA N-6-adenine-methyltransferase [Paramagnetospirillum caucaseum]